jgi:hypothetical protein
MRTVVHQPSGFNLPPPGMPKSRMKVRASGHADGAEVAEHAVHRWNSRFKMLPAGAVQQGADDERGDRHGEGDADG